MAGLVFFISHITPFEWRNVFSTDVLKSRFESIRTRSSVSVSTMPFLFRNIPLFFCDAADFFFSVRYNNATRSHYVFNQLLARRSFIDALGRNRKTTSGNLTKKKHQGIFR